MTKVYVVERNVKYESNDIVGVFNSPEGAEKYVMAFKPYGNRDDDPPVNWTYNEAESTIVHQTFTNTQVEDCYMTITIYEVQP